MIKKILLGLAVSITAWGVLTQDSYADDFHHLPNSNMSPLEMYGIDGKIIPDGNANIQGEWFDLKEDRQRSVRGVPLSYPITSVKADYVRDGRMTQKTQNIQVTIKGNIKFPDAGAGDYLGPSTYILLVADDDDRNEFSGTPEIGSDKKIFHDTVVKDRPRQSPFYVDETTTTINMHANDGLGGNTPLFPKAGKKVYIANQTHAVPSSTSTSGIFFTTRQEYQTVSQLHLTPTLDGGIKPGATTLSGTGTQEGDIITVIINGVAQKETTTVDENGNWSLPLSNLPAGASVVVKETNDYGDISVPTDPQTVSGELKFVNIPTDGQNNVMDFGEAQLKSGAMTIMNPKDQAGNPWSVYVYDSYGSNDKWNVFASSDGKLKLQGDADEQHTLNDAIKYKQSDNRLVSLSKDENNPTLIFTNNEQNPVYQNTILNTNGLGDHVTQARFVNDSGIMLHQDSSAGIYTNKPYTGIINLTLSNAVE